MEVLLVDDTQAGQWDGLARAAPSFLLMQSWDWGNVKRALGWEPYRVAVADSGVLVAGAQMLVRTLPTGVASVAYVPCGPIGEWTRPETAAPLFAALHDIARSKRAAFLKVEPSALADSEARSILAEQGFVPSSTANQPRATIVMDVSPEPEVILRSMRDSTRRKIGSTERKGVAVRLGTHDDLPVFYDLMKVTAARAGFPLRSYEYFDTEFTTMDRAGGAAILLAEFEGQPVAAHIAYSFGPHVAFLHQASAPGPSALNPNCLLVWRFVEWAKSKGCTTFDLWGIPDETAEIIAAGGELPTDRTDGLWGVYRFKSGFSKNVITYVPSHDYVYSRVLHGLASVGAQNQATLERVSAWLDGLGGPRGS
jgi:lipid II:glycine glycyltransferase (peptidoglycan interpeptide bridge formation enzyme)